MSEMFATLFARTREWFERARAAGWLDPSDMERLAGVEQATPADLFRGADQDAPAPQDRPRPLVVAFFGGTGVGKSSLLNRLVGEAVARTGLERPTSREVTLYVHRSVALADLPPELPVARVQFRQHASDERRAVVWIDAPDIDSTEEDNRRCALRWLPYIDLLIYVVSPERYRDDVGWRVLLERGHKHGWMFVLNRWDEGDTSQRDDFARMLREARFEAPLLLCTCCAATDAPLPTPDQFEQIEAAIRDLLRDHGVRELERLGHRARLLELRSAVNAALPRFGDERHWEDLSSAAQRHWERTQAAIMDGMEWPMRMVAGRLAAREGGLFGQVAQHIKHAAGSGSKNQKESTDEAAEDTGSSAMASRLWDDWTQGKVDAALDAVEVEYRRANVAVSPGRSRLDGLGQAAGNLVRQHVEDRLRAALAAPGTVLERALRRITGFLMVLLPVSALAWIAWVVVRRYHYAAAGNADFLGIPFAVHSAALVLAAWGLPYLLDRSLRPSLERVALRAMRRGLADGLDELRWRLDAALRETAREGLAYREEGKRIVVELARVAIRPIEARSATLTRLLATPTREPANV